MSKRVVFNLFPGGKNKALTMSYDDGRTQDRRLVELFNKYGLKGTFHLNSGYTKDRVYGEEIKTLYQGHEVSIHTVMHPSLPNVPRASMVREVWEDRKSFEAIVGYPVTGMSYPNGTYNDEVLEVLRQCGIVYSRTTKSTNFFNLPDDYLQWHPTCHHAHAMTLAGQFKELKKDSSRPRLLYVWGHSYEFDWNAPDNSWEMIEEFCKLVAHDPDIWYATNMEIYEYHMALKSLVFSTDSSIVKNPSAMDVWVSADGASQKIAAGQILNI